MNQDFDGLFNIFNNGFLNHSEYKYIMSKIIKQYNLTEEDVDRIVEMAWEDRTPFDAIERQFGVPEKDVIRLMKQEMTLKNWKKWRARAQGRNTKHEKKRVDGVDRFKCTRQRQITKNRISKR